MHSENGPAAVARREWDRSGDWLRKLERAGVIPPAPRDHAGYRHYTSEHIALIREIVSGLQAERLAREQERRAK